MKFGKFVFIMLLALLARLHPAAAQGTTAFTYQGQLHDTGTNANGTYTMVFGLYDAAAGGTQIGSSLSNATTLANGLFTVNLDFGTAAFNGKARWLDIAVQTGTNAAETLAPRVQLLPTTYALYAANAATAATDTTSGAVTNSGWSEEVGTYQGHNNSLLVSDNGSLVLGLGAGGGIVNGGLQVNSLQINSVGLNDDGQGQFTVSDGIIASNLVLNGNSISFPTRTGANVTVDAGGDFIFNGNVQLTSLGFIAFPLNSSATLSAATNGIHINGGLQENGYTSILGDEGVSGSLRVGNMIYGTLYQPSDRNLKTGFATVNSARILDQVTRLPISSWNYKTDGATRHIGPMAQDFYAAFNLGVDDKHIATVDEGGVALAAIQGLNEKLQAELKRQDAENAKLREQNNVLFQRLDGLEAALKALAEKK